MIFRQIFDSESCSFTYLLGANGEAALVDGVFENLESDLRLAASLGLRLTHAVETHTHADHRTSAARIRERTGAKLCAGVRGPPSADLALSEGTPLLVGGVEIEVLETPGHTEDGICLRFGGRVLTGDTLLIGATGRCDLQNGDPGQLYDSIVEKLFVLSDGTEVYPGHDYNGRAVSTIGTERSQNPRLCGVSRAEFIAAEQALKRPLPRRIAEVLPLNRSWGG